MGQGVALPPPRPLRLGDTGEHTLRDALLACLLLALALAAAALLRRDGWTVPSRMEPYLRAGPRHGALALERDLLALHPRGGEVGSLFAALARLGFACAAPEPAPDRGSACRFRARRGDDRLEEVVVELRHDGVRLHDIAVRMAVTSP